MPQPENRTASSRGPRHAAGKTAFAPRLNVPRLNLSPRTVRFAASGDVTDTARHRRPESLADLVRLPPAPQPSKPRRRGERGRHAAPYDLAITVRPLPAVRDVVVEGLPAAKRMADAFREWAFDNGDRPPATGTHRAPGTLPIESWLLVGKARQQALLATLVAVGVMLIVIPVQQYQRDVNPVSAAERDTAVDGQGVKTTNPAGTPTHSGPATKPKTPEKPAAPAAAPTSSGSQGKPAKAQDGSGPANSLRTTGTNAVALTFDDGPDPAQTPRILAELAKHHVKAVFCLVGEQVAKHPEIVRQIVADGHTLCNHTWDHSLVIGKEKPADIHADLQRTNDAIHAAVPGAQIPFFRAPGGNFTNKLVKQATADGMTSLYWQVDPRDWDHPTGEDDEEHVDRVIDDVKKFVRPGSIVLSHDFNEPDTIAAYEQLLPWLTKNFELGLPQEEQPTPAEPSSPPVSSPPASVAPAEESAAQSDT